MGKAKSVIASFTVTNVGIGDAWFCNLFGNVFRVMDYCCSINCIFNGMISVIYKLIGYYHIYLKPSSK